MKRFLLILLVCAGVALVVLGVVFRVGGLESTSTIGTIDGKNSTTVSGEADNMIAYGAIGGGLVISGAAGLALKKKGK